MFYLRLGYYVVALVLAVTGIVNTVTVGQQRRVIGQLRSRLEIVERIKDRFRDRRMNADDTDECHCCKASVLQLQDIVDSHEKRLKVVEAPPDP